MTKFYLNLNLVKFVKKQKHLLRKTATEILFSTLNLISNFLLYLFLRSERILF